MIPSKKSDETVAPCTPPKKNKKNSHGKPEIIIPFEKGNKTFKPNLHF